MTDILVACFNPDDFISWPIDRQLDRHERVMLWHERNASLGSEKVPFSWGAYQILSQVNPSPVTHLLIAVYRVESVREFDKIMLSDPLRLVSKYTTVLLDELEGDYETDEQRLKENLMRLKVEDASVNLFSSRTDKTEFEKIRSRYVTAPDFVGKYPFKKAPYPERSYGKATLMAADLEDPSLEFLIHGMNLEDDPAWDDATKAIHYEKVLWWHHYIAKMISEDKITHAWGTKDFCDIGQFSSRSASGMAIYKAKDLDDFADIYKQDPLRTRARFWSVALKPIDTQRKDDEETLKQLRQDYLSSARIVGSGRADI